ncbi:Zinc/iron permease [Tepidanaerobacter acetatoxydans Re1]|uniref:Zinc/iron permease n=1 Tax=Tepidanaerobacter acetatoxydans (strain DSM 21804 / JCM 16047 / Re1) TaxID=1209989 RepID=F4LWB7_TEPAE|nr:ZIP family metal transporter [Tepidanaerobacter acetatoxydans]AEE91715.1 zinc/iron permease [Tepidanaerobacter acetatoxydans Re1]CDI40783.1 Zinc/iron permease [Tepidanaerobacter acetatoxydans Re1]
MHTFFKILFFSSISGLAVVLGGYLGTKNIPDKILAFILAFGSGVLLSVLSYSLMHEAYQLSGPFFTSLAFLIGGAFFYIVESLLAKFVAPGTGAILGTALDDLPEALSMGIGFATDEGKLGVVIALSVLLHNIPEGISSTGDLMDKVGLTAKSAMVLAITIALLDPLAALTGYYLLKNLSDIWLGMIMAFSGGSILFMTGTSLIPKAHSLGTHLENAGLLFGFLAAFLISRLM